MSFREFFELYKRDRKPRIRENTWRTKEAIVNQKILPYIGDLMLNEINNVTIIQWQNELMKIKDKNGKNYSPTYLKTIHAQLSSILNHACRYCNLKTNVARDVSSMGEKEADEMDRGSKKSQVRSNKTNDWKDLLEADAKDVLK